MDKTLEEICKKIVPDWNNLNTQVKAEWEDAVSVVLNDLQKKFGKD